MLTFCGALAWHSHARDSCPRFLPAIPARDSCPRFLPAIPGLLVAPLPALAARPSLSNVRQELERRKANPPGAVVPTELAEPFRPRAERCPLLAPRLDPLYASRLA